MTVADNQKKKEPSTSESKPSESRVHYVYNDKDDVSMEERRALLARYTPKKTKTAPAAY